MLNEETDMQKEDQSKSIESRKKLNFWARFILSLVVFAAFFVLLYLLSVSYTLLTLPTILLV